MGLDPVRPEGGGWRGKEAGMFESLIDRGGRWPLRRPARLAWLGLVLPLVGSGRLAAGEPKGTIVLAEAVTRGAASRVRIELKASGLARPGLPPGKVAANAKMPKPLALEVETRLIFSERVLALTEDAGPLGGPQVADRGRPRKVVRHVIEAAAAINVEGQPRATSLRPAVSLLVAERRRQGNPVVVVSPAGPLSRSELELVEVPGDPLTLIDLLPSRPVGVGQSWRVGEAAVTAISGYDQIKDNHLDATLESCDEARAQVRIRGRIDGWLQGAEGLMSCDGLLGFDRRMGWIDRLEINRNESRRPGPIEEGVDVKSTLSVTRQAETPPATLNDAALAGYSLAIDPRSELLVQDAPDEKSSLLHDRNWHVFWGDSKSMVLKRLQGGRVVAQCNLVVAPAAGRGRHQDPAQFRDEVRRALGKRFVDFIGSGVVDGDPAGGFRFKVGVQGREGDVGIVWYYYLIASPAGDQLVATYTLAARDAQAFGEQDVEMMGSLRWNSPRQAARRD
jgi:hypothetical protein